MSHIIHVWYIYLHVVDVYGFHVGKHTIHGSCNLKGDNPMYRSFRRVSTPTF